MEFGAAQPVLPPHVCCYTLTVRLLPSAAAHSTQLSTILFTLCLHYITYYGVQVAEMCSEVREWRIRSSRAAYPYVVLRYVRLMEWSSARDPKEVASASMPIRAVSYRIASATSLCAFSASMSRLPRDDLLDVQSDVQYYIIHECCFLFYSVLFALCCTSALPSRFAMPFPRDFTSAFLVSSSRLVTSQIQSEVALCYLISNAVYGYCTVL